MKPPFIELKWHDECLRQILVNHRRSGIAIIRGRPLSGRRRFLVNLPTSEAVVSSRGSFHVFNCPPCGTEREILVRLARKLGIEECRDHDPRSELFIVERIAEGIGRESTLVINDAHRMAASLIQTIIGIRNLVEDAGGSLALVLGTTYSANHFLVQGVPEEEVSCVYEIPDLDPGELLGCLVELCPDQTRILAASVSGRSPDARALVNELQNRNLVRIGLIAEFAAIAIEEHPDEGIESVGLAVIRKMENECRVMERLPQRSSEIQPDMFARI